MVLPNLGTAHPRQHAHIALAPFRLIWMLVFLGIAWSAETASGQTLSDEGADGNTAVHRLVVICSDFSEEEVEAIRKSIFAHVADLEVEVYFHSVSQTPGTAEGQKNSATTMMTNSGAETAFFIYPKDARITLKTVLRSGNNLKISSRAIDVSAGTPLHEALGNIIRVATETILKKKEEQVSLEIERKVPSAPPSEPLKTRVPPPASSTVPHFMNFTAGVSLAFFSRGNAPWVGMDTTLGWQPFKSLSFHLGYTFFSEMNAEANNVRLSVNRHPLRLGVGYIKPLNTSWFGAGMSFLVDYTTERLSSKSENWTLGDTGAEFNLSMLIFAQMTFELFEPIHFYINVAGEIPLSTIDYKLSSSKKDNILLKTLPLQPVFTAGLCLYFF